MDLFSKNKHTHTHKEFSFKLAEEILQIIQSRVSRWHYKNLTRKIRAYFSDKLINVPFIREKNNIKKKLSSSIYIPKAWRVSLKHLIKQNYIYLFLKNSAKSMFHKLLMNVNSKYTDLSISMSYFRFRLPKKKLFWFFFHSWTLTQPKVLTLDWRRFQVNWRLWLKIYGQWSRLRKHKKIAEQQLMFPP